MRTILHFPEAPWPIHYNVLLSPLPKCVWTLSTALYLHHVPLIEASVIISHLAAFQLSPHFHSWLLPKVKGNLILSPARSPLVAPPILFMAYEAPSVWSLLVYLLELILSLSLLTSLSPKAWPAFCSLKVTYHLASGLSVPLSSGR